MPIEVARVRLSIALVLACVACGPGAPLPVAEAVAALTRTIERLTPEETGAFLDRDGRHLPW